MSETVDNVSNKENLNTDNGETSDNVQMEINNSNEETPAKTRHVDLSKSVTTNIGLLLNLRQILDASITRGTYKGNELTQVGQIYDQLSSVLNTSLNE